MLLNIISNQSPVGSAFQQHIWKYNSALSFTSMGISVDQELSNACDGVYMYWIQGAVVHEMGALQPWFLTNIWYSLFNSYLVRIFEYE
jgi:hypothetical protein